jgi:hypothetical protein
MIEGLLIALLIALLACGWYTFGFLITLIWTVPAAIVCYILIVLYDKWGVLTAQANNYFQQEDDFRRTQIAKQKEAEEVLKSIDSKLEGWKEGWKS